MKSAVLVFNPKRARALRARLGELNDRTHHHQVVNYLASVARSIEPY